MKTKATKIKTPKIEYRVAQPLQPKDFLRLVIQVEDTAANRASMSDLICNIRLNTSFDASRYNILKCENVHIAEVCRTTY